LKRLTHLTHLIFTDSGLSMSFYFGQRREEQREQNSDNRDYNKQLHKRKCVPAAALQ
jgi:hypothetical protein